MLLLWQARAYGQRMPFSQTTTREAPEAYILKETLPNVLQEATLIEIYEVTPSRLHTSSTCSIYSIEEMNEDANNKEMEENDDQGSYLEGYQENYDHESYQESQMDDVPSLAVRTAKLNEGQRETWLKEMRQLSINF